MSTRSPFKLYTMICLTVSCILSANAQEQIMGRSAANDTGYFVKVLETGTWQDIDQMFKDLPTNNESVNNALINRLEFENNRFADEIIKNNETEAYGELYISLIDRVAKIDSDKIIPPLINSLTFIGGIQIPDALAKRASMSLPLLIEKYDSAGIDLKRRILLTIERIAFYNADLGKNTSLIKTKLQSLLQKGLEDENPFIRKRALHAVIPQKDPIYLPFLEKIAASDPYFTMRDNKNDKSDLITYPLRELAAKRLDATKNKTK